MASFGFDIPDIPNLRASVLDVAAPRMIQAASPIVIKAIRKRLVSHNLTGELIRSVYVSSAKKAKTGAWIANVGFKGTDSKGVRNMVKAAELEYGNSKQNATPFMVAAQKDAESQVAAEMQRVYTEVLNGS